MALASCAPPSETDKLAHPSLAIFRLDRAAAAASHEGRATSLEDLDLGRAHQHPFDPGTAARNLAATVLGQDEVLRRVIDRLTLTRTKLDAKPDRPDAVFLFVGPTGVGKTALAHALAREVYGSESAVLRLDMSEFAEPHTTSKLVGSPPGYVGFTDPEGWLTTRIRGNPSVVLLLDEIEKAHPQVWNTFLQVFDAGRLTDSQGRTARFAETVIIMTSNIGAETFASDASLGFGERDRSAESEERSVLRAVKGRMAPELLNRLDDILVFRPLSPESILGITRNEIAHAVERARSRGFDLAVSEAAIRAIAQAGYSREYGARPLHRAVERLVLAPLARLTPGNCICDVANGEVTVLPAAGPDVASHQQ